MKVVFVYASYESLGVEYISAVLKSHGHSVELVFDPKLYNDHVIKIDTLSKIFSYKEQVINDVLKISPDVVCFSPVSDDYLWASDLAKSIKQHLDVPVVFGGIHATSIPEVVIKNEFIDFVVVGEGEYPLLELVECLEEGKKNYYIKNIWFKKNGRVIRNKLRQLINDLDKLPFPDKDLYYSKLSYLYGWH
jgi:radical SAM superfamily enzyme YgiQ (UPF0313 family)